MKRQEPGIVQVKGVSKSFGKLKAVRNVSLNVPAGTIFALLGPNGAGKTTLIRMLTTLLPPDSGTAKVAGFDVARQADEVRTTIGLAGQFAAVDETLTGMENLEMVGRLYRMSKADARARANEILRDLGLREAANRPVRTYSGGMRRRLDLGASFITTPKVLFLDEPTTGLDPHVRSELWDIIRDLVRSGTTIFLTTQYLEEAEELADMVSVIDRGRIVASGTVKELLKLVGERVLELSLADPTRLDEAAALLKKIKGAKGIKTEPADGQLMVHLRGSAKPVVEALQLLTEKGIEVSDLHLRHASLNEVFLKITHAGKGD